MEIAGNHKYGLMNPHKTGGIRSIKGCISRQTWLSLEMPVGGGAIRNTIRGQGAQAPWVGDPGHLSRGGRRLDGTGRGGKKRVPCAVSGRSSVGEGGGVGMTRGESRASSPASETRRHAARQRHGNPCAQCSVAEPCNTTSKAQQAMGAELFVIAPRL